MRVILIHGRSQQQKNPEELRLHWKSCIEAAFRRDGFELPDRIEMVFPFYGDDLDRLVQQVNGPLLTNILLRGEDDITQQEELRVEILDEMIRAKEIDRADIESKIPGDAAERSAALERGPQNWRFVLAMLRALDETPLGAKAIDEITRDVWVYLTFGGVQTRIDAIVNGMLNEEPSIVISHSLGTIVAYNVLSKRSENAPRVPLFLTLGSPLGIKAISARLQKPLANPGGVERWVNARDKRDVVALHPLDSTYFDIAPAIEDFSNVDNFDKDRHSIDGYLADAFVTRCIHEAL